MSCTQELAKLQRELAEQIDVETPRVEPIIPAHCNHPGWDPNDGKQCPLCGMFAHQFWADVEMRGGVRYDPTA